MSDISQLGLARTNYCTGCKARQDTIEAQAAEIKRLREALAKVLLVKQHTMNPIHTTQQMQRIARAALGETE